MKLRVGACLDLSEIQQPLFVQWLKEYLTVDNPQLIKLRRMGIYGARLPRHIIGYVPLSHGGLQVPRGIIWHVLSKAVEYGEPVVGIVDDRSAGSQLCVDFKGMLSPSQIAAVQRLLATPFGVLCAPTGSGKTVMALALIAYRQTSTMIIVHTKELLDQWVERIRQFLGIQQVGMIGAGHDKFGQIITVALVQSLHRRDSLPQVGQLIVDECHRCPARTFTAVVTRFSSQYMLGLSATPFRSDGLTQLIHWHLGPLVANIDRSTLETSGAIMAAKVICKETTYSTEYRLPVPKAFRAANHSLDAPTMSYSAMVSALVSDTMRTSTIVRDIVEATATRRGACLVLSDRKSHCYDIHAGLSQHGVHARLLLGDMLVGDRAAVVRAVQAGEVKVLVATGQLAGEGFDCAGLSTLFLATPIKFTGRLVQYMGRVLRPGPHKEQPVIYDYVDIHVPVFSRAFRERKRMYTQLGWQVVQIQCR